MTPQRERNVSKKVSKDTWRKDKRVRFLFLSGSDRVKNCFLSETNKSKRKPITSQVEDSQVSTTISDKS